MSGTTRHPGGLDVKALDWGFRHAGRRAWAVRHLDVSIAAGERVLLAGPSGSGKSTLLTALAGLLDPEQSGEVEGALLVGGQRPEEVRDRVGLAFQDPETQLVMARAGDDVAFGLENLAVPTDEIWSRVDEAFEVTGFPYGREHATNRLSGGEKQRLVLAGVVALRPGLLLLDEPTANLDPPGAALVRAAIGRTVAATGATLVVVDHRVDEWLPFVDRVLVLAPGDGLLADGDPASVFGRQGAALDAAGIWTPGWSPPPRPRPAVSDVPVLWGEELTYTYPRATRPAVENATLALRPGETVAVTGHNGSGKSTFAMMMAGLLPPSSGAVRVAAELVPAPPRRWPGGRRGQAAQMVGARERGLPHARPLHRWQASHLVRAVGTVFQDPEHQFLTPTVRAELSLGPRLLGRPDARIRARVDELLERLRLAHLAEANPFTLSGGEKRRLSVATALATSPRVLVLDEPTFGQDRRTWLELLDLLADLRDAGHAVLCVSHDPDFVAALADAVVEVHRGRMSAPAHVKETRS